MQIISQQKNFFFEGISQQFWFFKKKVRLFRIIFSFKEEWDSRKIIGPVNWVWIKPHSGPKFLSLCMPTSLYLYPT